MKVSVSGISVIAPAISGWDDMRPVLRGDEPWPEGDLVLSAPDILAPRERRRTSPSLRLALNAAVDACRMAGYPLDDVASVFGSAVGDGDVCDGILTALSRPDRLVSPTQFHNSVHNAAAGYWSIGTGNQHTSISIAAGGATFGAGLLRAVTMVMSERRPTVLVVSDHPMPGLLGDMCPMDCAMAVGLLLTPAGAGAGSVASLEIRGAAGSPETVPGDRALQRYFDGTTAGRALPVLAAIANNSPSPKDVVCAAGVNGYGIKVRISS
ncbi:MAG: beta-ketoacyl synthase chain length factor [Rhodospirillales bacterium]|nr:beta-ketoacyl synthase chain length factor [Rhodospirillales bacterium]